MEEYLREQLHREPRYWEDTVKISSLLRKSMKFLMNLCLSKVYITFYGSNIVLSSTFGGRNIMSTKFIETNTDRIKYKNILSSIDSSSMSFDIIAISLGATSTSPNSLSH